MHKKVRKHSALLLLMAPVMAIGSSFLVAGSANATVKTAKKSSQQSQFVSPIAGSFHFSINGKLLSLSKSVRRSHGQGRSQPRHRDLGACFVPEPCSHLGEPERGPCRAPP